ncbi:HEAT repeat domain-containing protein [Bacillus sp. Marseille-P3661]|uniref:HEAT repeat domain-containing protein n=1 Tax=Bacillus sp. Marseille-P3661 TaxID=1936234 RepID=UPI000C84AC5F|nr:HEAT repeat domain-containing protein [Bacillus sp. Marseille-P3661]
MDTQKYLLDLIQRMLDDTLEYVPDVNGSMYVIANSAYKEAEKLADAKYIQPLKNIIEQHSSSKTKEKDIRRKAYHILEKLAINTEIREIFEYFADRLDKESDKYILGDCLLLYLDRNQYTPKLDIILRLSDDIRWQVRDMVIKMLGNYPKQEVEDLLIHKLADVKDQYEICHLLSSLRKIRSAKVLDVIGEYLQHDKGEVRASAIATAKELGGKEFLPTYIACLKDRSREVKLNALDALLKHGDESIIEVLFERLKTILKTKRNVEPATAEDSDVINIVQFLLRYKYMKEVTTIFDWIWQKKWDYLYECEKEWLRVNANRD